MFCCNFSFLHRGMIKPLRLIVTWLGLFLLPSAYTQTPTIALPLSTSTSTIDTANVSSALTSKASDSVILEMSRAFRKRDEATLTALLPQAAGHVLEPWAAYWEMNVRLPTISSAEMQAWLLRYANTYQEDRLRNDWLLQLGQNGDWETFARFYPGFRMRDDQAVRCYAVMAAQPLRLSPEESLLMLHEAWFSRSGNVSACVQAANKLYAQGLLTETDIWRKARQAAEKRQASAARDAVGILDATTATQVAALFSDPQSALNGADFSSARGRELVVLAVARLAALDPTAAAQWLQGPAASPLSTSQLDWLWGSIGRQAALNLDLQASNYFSLAQNLHHLTHEQLSWMARSAMRLGKWHQVRRAISAMDSESKQEPIWIYWLARSLQNGQQRPAQRPPQAEALLHKIAGHDNFYALLALEELRGSINAPAPAREPNAQELNQASSNPGLVRALYARALGLNSEAIREWNYATNLHLRGGMNDRDLLATAALACQQQWWDRCINTSERTRHYFHTGQRFPMPYRDNIVYWSQQAGLDPSWVFGLIRQESRFVSQARSSAGASGLMQVMPGTARLVARKLGLPLTSFNGIDGNLQLGTSYLAQLQTEFNSDTLISAGYNAGPGRPRRWREGPTIEGAIWVENIPFHETRDYVKKVLSNSVNYALLMHVGQEQSLYTRLGTVAPTNAQTSDSSDDNTALGLEKDAE